MRLGDFHKTMVMVHHCVLLGVVIFILLSLVIVQIGSTRAMQEEGDPEHLYKSTISEVPEEDPRKV